MRRWLESVARGAKRLVIPAKAGIQGPPRVVRPLDPRFRGGDGKGSYSLHTQRALAAAILAATTAAGASAADLKILDIKASLYLEAQGKFSEPLADGKDLLNLAKGDGPDKTLASAVLVELTFSGDKNSAPKYATATVDVTQTSKTGQPIVTHKGFNNFVFGPDGVEHKAFMVESATCMPLQVEVHANKTMKKLRIPFDCKG